MLVIEESVRIEYRAMKKYVDRVGGSVIEEGDRVEIIIPVVIDEVAGGVQFRLKGHIENSDLVITQCNIHIEAEQRVKVNVKDLDPWLRYIAEKCQDLC